MPVDPVSTLSQCRERIDAIDLRILDMLNERTRIVEEIGRVKSEAQMAIYEPRREDQVFNNVTSHNSGPLHDDAVKRIFERVIDEMRKVQKNRMEEKRS